MITFQVMLHVIVLLIVSQLSIFGQIIPKYYDVSISKCDGSFSTEIGFTLLNTSMPEFISEYKNVSKAECRWICSRMVINCWMIEYFDNNNCRLYTNISFIISQGSSAIDAWLCADKVCGTWNSRCDGYWVGYDNFKISDLEHFPLKIFENITIHECQRSCENLDLCGSFNFECSPNIFSECSYIKGNCTLLYGFAPLLETIFHPIPSNIVRSWRCCPDNHKRFQDVTCKRRKTKNENIFIDGKWEIQENDIFSLKSYTFYTMFFSLNMKDCYEACSNDPFCIQPIFVKGDIPKCYLALNRETGNFEETQNMYDLLKGLSYEIWKWKDCDKNNNSTNQIYKNKLCFCFPKHIKIKIEYIDCGKFYDIDDYGTLNLYSNNNNTATLNDGKQNYAIELPGNNEIISCDMFNCDFYNAMVYFDRKKPQFVRRDEWFSLKPLRKSSLILPVEFVIILNTYRPHGRCFSKQVCSFFVFDFQRFHMKFSGFDDIAYNFLIGEDGNVYEGRGWFNIGAHTKGYNTQSIGVAFIGWFETVYPNEKSLLALRDLIEYGIQKKYLKDNVSIKNNRDFRPTEIPGKKLKEIIENWKVVNLTQFNKCLQKNSEIPEFVKYLLIGFALASVIIIIHFFVLYDIHKKKSCKRMLSRTVLKKETFECIYNAVNINSFCKINLKNDWIYICENKEGNNSNCFCSLEMGLFWMYCMLSDGQCFLNKLKTLFRLGSCKKQNFVFVHKHGNNLEPKLVYIFHLNVANNFCVDDLFDTLSLQKGCICKDYSIKEFPQTSHNDFFQSYASFSKNTINMVERENLYESCYKDSLNIYTTKCKSTLSSKISVNFNDIS